jgi:hypothetical protein
MTESRRPEDVAGGGVRALGTRDPVAMTVQEGNVSDDSSESQDISVSVPTGVIAAGIFIGMAALAAYIMASRSDEGASGVIAAKAKSGKGFGKKIGLMSLITLIENDATRKVVVAVLRAIARRS